MKIIYLKPLSGYRSPLRSDTLWGLLCWSIRHLYGSAELESFIKGYKDLKHNNSKCFYITSTFPYKQIGKRKIPFFPIPKIPNTDNSFQCKDYLSSVTEMRKIKKARKQQLIEQDLFEQVIQGGKLKIDNEIKPPKQEVLAVTHNTIDRLKGATLQLNNQGQLFHVEEIFWSANEEKDPNNKDKDEEKNNVGLYFLAKGEDLSLLEGALRYLAHTGFAGDKGTGKGHFEVSWKDFELKEPTDFNAVTNLSLYAPQPEELDTYTTSKSSSFYYTIEDRQGKIGYLAQKGKKIWKDVLMMFKEGSIFPVTPKEYKEQYGDNPIVKEKGEDSHHAITHYGHAFMIKMKIPTS